LQERGNGRGSNNGSRNNYSSNNVSKGSNIKATLKQCKGNPQIKPPNPHQPNEGLECVEEEEEEKKKMSVMTP
jgi:hypothetical protein